MMNIIEALNWRYAAKTFDFSKKVSDADLHSILESGRLAPSSFGTEPWKFLVIENPDLRARLREVGYGQTKITDASYLIVVARRTDIREHIADELIARSAKIQNVQLDDLAEYKQMVAGSIAMKSDERLDAWAGAQTYIALGMMMETAALLRIDSCPMEGFDPAKADEILGLKAKNLASTTMLAIGYRGEDEAAKRPKVRRTFEEAVEFIK